MDPPRRAWRGRPTRRTGRGGTTGPARRYAVICGYGRVGRLVGAALERRGFPYVVIEVDPRVCRELRERGMTVIQGLAENQRNLDRAELSRAQVVVVTVTDPIAMRQVVHHVRARAPATADHRTRSHSDGARAARKARESARSCLPETEVALEMARFTLVSTRRQRAGDPGDRQGLRRRTAPAEACGAS